MKIFCAFFGLLTATGMAVLLTALVAAAGAGISLASSASSASDVANAVQDKGVSVDEIGWAGVILVLVSLSYYAGGYVSGRMARFDGIRNGAAVFAWSVLVAIAIVIAILGAVAGAKYDVLDKLNSFPRIPSNLSDLTTQGIVVLVGVIAAALVGSMVGGLAGMHFHRLVDRTGLGH